MNGRIYDPTLGRFLQADPFIQAPKNSQSYNRYSYVLNNPLNFTDPSGYFSDPLKKAHDYIKKRGRTSIRSAAKVFGTELVNYVGSAVASYFGGAWGAAAWSYEFTRAMGGSSSSALKGAFTAYIGSYVNASDSLNDYQKFAINYGLDEIINSNDQQASIPVYSDAHFAQLAQCVYPDANCNGVAGYGRLSDTALGLNSALYKNVQIGFDAALFYNPSNDSYVLSFAGTDQIRDIKSYNHSIGYTSMQLAMAVDIAHQVSRRLGKNAKLTYVGHSLGGALASGAALTTNRSAIIFNAQGISDGSLHQFGIDTRFQNYLIHHYYLPFDQVNFLLKPYGIGGLGRQTMLLPPNAIKFGHSISHVCVAMGVSCE